MKVRICDVAKKANVSSATVSNALNNRSGVSDQVAKRITRIASEMGYEPQKGKINSECKYIRLVVFKSHGLVIMDSQFFSELIESIQRECSLSGLELLISHLNASDTNLSTHSQEIRSETCAGILLLGTEMSSGELEWFLPCKSPLIVLDNLFCHENVNSIVMNNYEAGYMATKMLYQSGHHEIGHITSSVPFSNARDRCKGYQAALESEGIAAIQDSIWYVTPTMDGAYYDMQKLLVSTRKLPTAFFACNDIIAIGCIRALQEKGIQIPEDVSIIGMDNLSICMFSRPSLSTLQVFRQEIGITAVQTLLTLASRMKSSIMKIEISVDIIMRNSIRIIDV